MMPREESASSIRQGNQREQREGWQAESTREESVLDVRARKAHTVIPPAVSEIPTLRCQRENDT